MNFLHFHASTDYIFSLPYFLRFRLTHFHCLVVLPSRGIVVELFSIRDLVDKNDTKNFSEGYQVSFENSLKFTDKDYDNIVYTFSCLIGLDANIRVYKNVSKISFHVNNLNTSFSLAALFNQESLILSLSERLTIFCCFSYCP